MVLVSEKEKVKRQNLSVMSVVFCIYNDCTNDAGDLIGFLNKGFPITIHPGFFQQPQPIYGLSLLLP
jgi:hypothetical protein